MKLSLAIAINDTATADTIARIVDTLSQIPGIDDVRIVTGERPGLARAAVRVAEPARERATGTMGANAELPDVVGNTPNASTWTGTKSDFVRKHPTMSPTDLSALAKRHGLDIPTNVIGSLRYRDGQRAAAKSKARKGGK